jgi:hypothetical protein
MSARSTPYSSRLYEPEEPLMRRTAAYYAVLNEQTDFRMALRETRYTQFRNLTG